jgi:hypothetical protein
VLSTSAVHNLSKNDYPSSCALPILWQSQSVGEIVPSTRHSPLPSCRDQGRRRFLPCIRFFPARTSGVSSPLLASKAAFAGLYTQQVRPRLFHRRLCGQTWVFTIQGAFYQQELECLPEPLADLAVSPPQSNAQHPFAGGSFLNLS